MTAQHLAPSHSPTCTCPRLNMDGTHRPGCGFGPSLLTPRHAGGDAMTAPIVTHLLRRPIPWPAVRGAQSRTVNLYDAVELRRTSGQLWERVAERGASR